MIKVITRIRYLMVLQLSALLWACVQAPQPQQQSYWHVKAQDYMQSGLQYYQRQQFRQAEDAFKKVEVDIIPNVSRNAIDESKITDFPKNLI